jgi:hypothetical protein
VIGELYLHDDGLPLLGDKQQVRGTSARDRYLPAHQRYRQLSFGDQQFSSVCWTSKSSSSRSLLNAWGIIGIAP